MQACSIKRIFYYLLTLTLIGLNPPVLAVEVGYYSSSWTKWGVEKNSQETLFIYQSLYPPDEETISQIQKSACANNKKAIFRQELDDKTHKDINFTQKEIEKRSAVIAKAYSNNCQKQTITLDEENIFWKKRSVFLDKFYIEIKKLNPTLDILQWYSGSKKNNAPGVGRWPKLNADGWVFDQYEMQHDIYQNFLESIRENSTNLYSILWLSPQWNIAKNKIDSEYWNASGREILRGKLNENIKHHIPTLFFFYYKSKTGLIPFHIAKEFDKCNRDFFDTFRTHTIMKIKNDTPLELGDIPMWCK